MNDLFFKAAVNKTRFISSTGVFSGERTTEQLFDLGDRKLDALQMEYDALIESTPKSKSRLTGTKTKNPELKFKLKVVNSILDYAIERNKASLDMIDERAKKERLLAQYEVIEQRDLDSMTKKDFLAKYGKELGLVG